MPSPQPDIKAAKIWLPDLLGFRNIASYKKDIRVGSLENWASGT